MHQLVIIVTAFLGALGSRVAKPTPGTETILLVKGGYGPGLNLISTTPATTKRRHGVQKAPMDRTQKEEVEVKSLDEVGKVVSTLQTQIAEVGKETAKVLSESEASRVERAQLNDKLSKDSAVLEQEDTMHHEVAQLQMQAQQLRSQITAEKAKTAAEKARSEAFVSKVQMLEKNMHVLSKAWKGLATHEASLAKAAQMKSAPPAKPAPAAKKVAAVPAKKESSKLKPKVIHTAPTGKKVAAKVQKNTGAVPVAEDDITDDVLASDSDDDAEEDESQAAKVASADTSDSDADTDADSQVDDDSDSN